MSSTTVKMALLKPKPGSLTPPPPGQPSGLCPGLNGVVRQPQDSRPLRPPFNKSWIRHCISLETELGSFPSL